ncbi:hypothetical protein QAD02_010045 [Eretmocerus hayati]|uniref:Uncharacterized protein n=1 Tax=Eretmocerus hayati TaxID=131215 RepID=A0ACC2NDI4_9HYME|nr:hypothetical protein QAD02_010045 [Eretmocerus hayati]
MERMQNTADEISELESHYYRNNLQNGNGRLKELGQVHLKSRRMNHILKLRLVQERRACMKLRKKVDRLYRQERYDELIRRGFPIPSLRTSSRKLEGWNFESGPSDGTFQFLEVKVSHFREINKDCVVIPYKMSTAGDGKSNTCSRKYVGCATLAVYGNQKVLATKVLVIMLAINANRWKQVVEYCFSCEEVGVLSSDGRCKPWDKTSDGYVRSEAVSVILLQKKSDAKRIYATIVNTKVNCDGFKMEGLAHPSSKMQTQLMKSCYEECKISPSRIKYVEAHGTGTKVGDFMEIGSINATFCEEIERSEPLLIGTIKSNLGHSEAASGVVSIIKVILCMETGVLLPNLHFNEPRPDLIPIVAGKMKVITEVTPYELEYVGINSLGIGGTNAHVILRAHDKKKVNGGAPVDDLPRLVCVSGRTEEAVQAILDDLENRPIDAEYVRLFHDINAYGITGHLFRGYTLLEQIKDGDNHYRRIEPSDEMSRPIWFIFSGMGSQWRGMGESLLRLPIFAKSVSKCDAVLKPLGFDIYQALIEKDESKPMSTLDSMVGIIVFQIALVDILNSLGFKPQNLVGHSIGETSCAYADGSLSFEQVVLAAYYRGLVASETKIIHGTMAAVGLGFKDLKDVCPPGITIACHNSSTSSTISGPTDLVKAVMLKLQENKIFVKEVPTNNVPFHSQYIKDMGPKYLAYLRKIIPNAKRRSLNWLSTSVPEANWTSSSAQYSSPEYFVNNLLNPVLFEQVLAKVPKNAILIELAPHGILQAILKKSLSSQVSTLPLTSRNHPNNLKFFLESIGKLYNLGCQPDLAKLYPEIEYPVSRGTRSISHLIKWDYSSDAPVYKYDYHGYNTAGERFVGVSLNNSEYSSLAGHVIDGRNLFPATGYLKLVWETFSMMNDKHYSGMAVYFKDVQILRATTLFKEGEIIFRVNINIGSGRFEVSENKVLVASGFIYDSSHSEARILDAHDTEHQEEVLTNVDVYKKFKLQGCDYTDIFRSIQSSTLDGSRGHIRWRDDWIAFLDNMLQMSQMTHDASLIHVPVRLSMVFIDPKAHCDAMSTLGPTKGNQCIFLLTKQVEYSGTHWSGRKVHS